MKKGILIKLDRERYLKFTLNSVRILEKEYNISLDKIGEDFAMEKIQMLLHVGLLKDDPELTFEEVGELVDMSNMKIVVEALTQALGGLQDQSN
ncbi:hypothetical protein UT300009_29250 [Paraclostridium bifermentans]|uniref:hypothetical protein n=1 Tax=Paraclostridium bifermentans TaxID=1490 RepID=UPI002910805D|nr:hypothetical protein [Paraclostridium bifermentans]MDU3338302.1 hypothetical protein [Paraclostridium bifermentans]